jgi:hypothetical protein
MSGVACGDWLLSRDSSKVRYDVERSFWFLESTSGQGGCRTQGIRITHVEVDKAASLSPISLSTSILGVLLQAFNVPTVGSE